MIVATDVSENLQIQFLEQSLIYELISDLNLRVCTMKIQSIYYINVCLVLLHAYHVTRLNFFAENLRCRDLEN